MKELVNELTCEPDYESMYNRVLEDNVKLKEKNYVLETELNHLKEECVELRAIKRAVEIVFGKDFGNKKED